MIDRIFKSYKSQQFVFNSRFKLEPTYAEIAVYPITHESCLKF